MTTNKKKNFDHNVRLLLVVGCTQHEAEREAMRLLNEIDDALDMEGWAAAEEHNEDAD